jgi:SAM-dependent methyltransferase
MKAFDDVLAFRAYLMQSTEWKIHNPPKVEKSFLAHTSRPEIETKMDKKTLENVVRKTASYWSKIGVNAPHWSVLTYEQYTPENIAKNVEEFYNSGIGDLYLVRDLLQRMDRDPNDFRCILEFGCGVGRATAALASGFDKVIALDISLPHIKVATERVATTGASNVRFVQVTPDNLMPANGYDLWYSRLVLQHNPPPVTLYILKKAFTRLPSSGVAIVHVRTHWDGYRFIVSEYLAQNPSSNMEMHATPQNSILELAYQCNCRLIELHEEPGHLDNITNIFVFEKNPVCRAAQFFPWKGRGDTWSRSSRGEEPVRSD